MTKIIPPSFFHKQQRGTMNLNKVPLNKENLMRQVTDVEIYQYYTGREISIRGSITSPIQDDRNPSFGYFIGKSGEICWKDFRLGSGDCISFVQQMFDLDFNQALIKIVKDFKLTDEFEFKDADVPLTDRQQAIELNRAETIKFLQKGRDLSIKSRKAEKHDIQFWLDFGITKKTLIKYNVTPIEYYIINGHIIPTDKYAYAFIEFKDGKPTYKIYQPFNKHYKWINNHDESVWQGWSQLPGTDEILIITKSLKDVMSINEVLNLPAVALQSESVNPKEKIVKELRSRFEDIYIFYDNDFDKSRNWGQEASKKLASQFGFYNIMIQDKWKSKDFSDLVKNHGAVKAFNAWCDEISIPF